MGKVNDLTGQRFGKLVVQYDTGQRTAHRSVIWHCACDCGNEVDVVGQSLTSGNTSSCGCLRNGKLLGGIGGCKPSDITGMRFGSLVAIRRVGETSDRESLWLMKCDCGNERIVRLGHLRRGATTTCGHNAKPHDKEDERLYRVFHGMKARCYNENNNVYKFYGAKGVRVCDEWLNDFQSFRDWAMANGYDPHAPRGECTIDRVDPYGDYSPDNCRWVSMEVQRGNKRRDRVQHGAII